MDILSLDQEVGAWDSVLLDPLNAETFITNLHQRFKRDHIYTYIGNVLVSINPYKKLALYSRDLIKAYWCKGPYQLPPHMYAIAGTAYRFLKDRNEDQCIILSGESGSGKTEASKILLQFLTLVCPSSASQELGLIKQHLIHANMLLEAFGNAKTCINDNSSRFGKYLDIEYDFKGDALGGTITNYPTKLAKVLELENQEGDHLDSETFLNASSLALAYHCVSQCLALAPSTLVRPLALQSAKEFTSTCLGLKDLLEKTRVTNQTHGNRNFHIFYQLISGADVHLLKALKLQRNIDSYVFLSTAVKGSSPEDLNYKEDFEKTKKSMEILGLTQDEVMWILKIVASILKLGNIIFIPMNNIDGTEGCSFSNEYELYEVCNLLETEPSSLQSALTCRVMDGSLEVIVTELSAVEASYTRDSLCKALYSRLFTYLVNKINDLIKVKKYGRRKFLGILDIYGFEIFEKNGFEQFIINFCNEKLQQLITNVTLKQEQEEYIREGIDWVPIDYLQNETICDLIEKNNHGILSKLDEECVKCGARSDEFFLSKIATYSGHPHFEVKIKSQRNYFTSDNSLPLNCFRLRHFAGTVTYVVDGFVEKNRDVLGRNISQAMYNCNHPLLKTLFPEGNPKRISVKTPATVGTQFKISLSALLQTLTSKQPHYIRCIKPNELKQPRIFETALVQHQIQYLCLLETVRVRRQGFCYKLEYQLFLSRFKMLSLRTWPKWTNGTPAEGVSYLLRDLPIPKGEFAFGRTKIFIRSPRTVFELEEFRRERLHDLATIIQKIWRGYRQRTHLRTIKESQIIIAKTWRGWKKKRELQNKKYEKKVLWAVGVIQKYFVTWKRREFLVTLSTELPSESPVCKEWPQSNPRLSETSVLLRKIYHKWRCYKFRLKFDQTARNRMREKVTASIIFKDRKASYPRSVSHPFLGDYVRLRHNVQWKKISLETNDQYVVFADIINKITRSSGKFVPILFVLSTNSMLILDQRTLQVKYRIPATEIYRLSLSPYLDDVAVFHVRTFSPHTGTVQCSSEQNSPPGCLFQSDLGRNKGDFVFQTGHVIEMVTKLFLVVQNAVGKPPEVNISSDFEATFSQQTVLFTFKCSRLPEVQQGQIRIFRKGNKMEITV